MNIHRGVFLDLNGTVVLPLKQESLAQLTLISGAVVAIRRLLLAGFICPVVTVQSRIEKGLFTEEEFRHWFITFFGNLDLDLKGPYICPHKFSNPCRCKKPSRFLYDQAASDFSLDFQRSYTIGDSPQDVLAAKGFGGLGCLVRTGWAADENVAEEVRDSAAFVGQTITDAVNWILLREEQIRNRKSNQAVESTR